MSVADPHMMKDVVTLTEDGAGVGRMVVLNTNQTVDSGEVELLSCPLHCTNTAGFGDKRVESLGGIARDIVVSAETNNIQKMLKFHGRSVPLASLLYCHYAEFEVIVTVVRSHYCLTIMIFFIPDSRLDQ